MPLQLQGGGSGTTGGVGRDELLLVTDIQPLTVIRANLSSGACQLVHGAPEIGSLHNREATSIGSSSAASGRGAAEGAAPAYAAVLGGAHLHGGSPFVHVGAGRYLR